MSGAVIRRATERDRDAVLSLFDVLEHTQRSQRTFPVAPDAASRFLTAFARATAAEDECFLLAEIDGAVVGMAHCSLDRPSKLSDVRAVEVGRLVVDPAVRGRGVARDLVAAAQAFGEERGVEAMTAKVFAANAPGARFWRSLGFEPSVEILARRRA